MPQISGHVPQISGHVLHVFVARATDFVAYGILITTADVELCTAFLLVLPHCKVVN